MKAKKSHKIGFYIRVSTEEQAENPEGSIKNQEERLRMTVKLKNMEGHFGEIKAVFVDRAKSGKDTNRPELQRLLLAIRKREIDLVMVSELSRISRSIKDFSDIWQLMQQNGCAFSSLRENFDTTTAAGEMVLFTVANIAQFERRQVSERISASFNARSQRGLYNGGCIPFGYTRIEGRPGFLTVEEDAAKVVRTVFKTFLHEGTLANTARWMNAQGYRITKKRDGGGAKERLGFFTVGNTGLMLKSKFYLGIKAYSHQGEKREIEAVWPAIIDRETFDKVNDQLNKNHRRNKDAQERRYPYLLSGMLSCKTCGSRLIGKSAHGKAGKIAYYEHGWAAKAGAFVPGLKSQCQPCRVLAKQLEPVLWGEILKLISDESYAQRLLQEARKAHLHEPGSREIEKCNHTIFSVDQQLDVMAERLASLPATISATPIYRQMEKLEAHKRAAQDSLDKLKARGVIRDQPAEMGEFRLFLSTVEDMLRGGEISLKTKLAIIRILVQKVLVTPEGFEVYFRTGETYVKRFTDGSDGHFFGTEEAPENGQKKGAESLGLSPDATQNLKVLCSNTCITGGATRIRYEHPILHRPPENNFISKTA